MASCHLKLKVSLCHRTILFCSCIFYLLAFSNATHMGSPEVKETKQVYLYRLLNWCVTGKGEYKLNEWPLSQFKPILELTYKNEQEWDDANADILQPYTGGSDPWQDYELKFSTITCPNMPKGYATNNAFLQRIHVKFVPRSTNAINFQGLLIQGVHGPFGLGFPFGAFDTNNDFTCKDTCEFYQYSRIVGCISRPDIASLHPTVAAFHYKLRGKTLTDPELEYDYQKELHWNYKWSNLACTSSRLVEFWVLMVIDFDNHAWTVKKFGPYDFNDKNVPFSNLEEPHKATAPAPGITPNELVQPGLSTPVEPECFPHKPLITISTQGRARACIRAFKLYDEKLCESWEAKLRLDASKIPPPPAGGPGEPFVPPTPPNEMECHGSDVTPPDLSAKTRVRIDGDFDTHCTRRFPGEIFEKMYGRRKRQPYKVCPEWQGRYYCQGSSAPTGDLHYDMEIEDAGPGAPRSFPFSHCDPCEPVTEAVTQAPVNTLPFFKRTDHGFMMIYAFFFFNPVSINVARFYKETLHDRQIKGWRTWLLIHVGFAAMTSMVAYIGYTFPSFTEIDVHIGLGYGALIGVSSGMLTGWIRHKSQVLQVTMFYVHALSGYLGWALAIASMAFAPGISNWTRLISYMASGICLAAMAIMTLHICSVDTSMGVRPRRSHIPIIEIRFDDIIPLKSKFRKIFLYVYIAVQFIICFGMMVL